MHETKAHNAGMEAASQVSAEWIVSVEVPGTWDRDAEYINNQEDEDPDWWSDTWTVSRWKVEVFKALVESGRLRLII